MARAIGHPIDRGIAAEREVDGAGAADGPAAFARGQVQQRAGIGTDDVVGDRLGREQRPEQRSLGQDLRPPHRHVAAACRD